MKKCREFLTKMSYEKNTSSKLSLKKVIIILSCPIILFGIYFFVLCILGYLYRVDYAGWQLVSFGNVGTLRVPEEWVVTIDDNVVFMTDKPLEDEDYLIYLVGGFATKGEELYLPNHDLFNDLELVAISFSMTSFSSRYGNIEYRLNGKSFTKLGADFGGLRKDQMSLIAWDDLVDEDTLFKIANSFRSER